MTSTDGPTSLWLRPELEEEDLEAGGSKNCGIGG
jgi:hypothetical protein